MFRELEPMVEDGLIYSDNALGDNTYRTIFPSKSIVLEQESRY